MEPKSKHTPCYRRWEAIEGEDDLRWFVAQERSGGGWDILGEAYNCTNAKAIADRLESMESINADLLDALRGLVGLGADGFGEHERQPAVIAARAAIAKATGED